MQGLAEPWPSGAVQGQSSSGRRKDLLGPKRLTQDDLVSVVPSDWKHMPLVKAMRSWRKVSARSGWVAGWKFFHFLNQDMACVALAPA